jgi:hypothetical protein
MRLVAKNYPFIHKSSTLFVFCALRGESLQWTQRVVYLSFRKFELLYPSPSLLR